MLRLRCYCLGLLFLSAGWAAAPADQAEKAQQSAGFPPGMVAMFSGASCPEGWTDEPLTQGRIPIGAATPAESGEVVGEPFVDKKPVLHQHAYFFATEITGSVMPASGSFGLQWVLIQKVEWEGLTDGRDSGLPFHATRMCRQSVAP